MMEGHVKLLQDELVDLVCGMHAVVHAMEDVLIEGADSMEAKRRLEKLAVELLKEASRMMESILE